MTAEKKMMHPSSEKGHAGQSREILNNHGTSHLGINFQAHEGECSDLEQPAWIYKGKSCQTNLIVSCDEVTSSVKEGKADNVVYLEFSKVFHVVSQRILVSNFKWIVRQKT